MSKEYFKSMLATPPGSPAVGDVHLVTTSPTDAWVGKTRKLAKARSTTGAWLFYTPQVGERWYDEGTGLDYIWDGTNWVGIVAPWDMSYYSTHATSVGSERVGYLTSSSSNTAKWPKTGFEVRVTAADYKITGGATAGTYTMRLMINTDSSEEVYSADFTLIEDEVKRDTLDGSIISPVIKAVGSNNSNSFARVGWENKTGNPGALANEVHFVHFRGYLCKVI